MMASYLRGCLVLAKFNEDTRTFMAKKVLR